MYLTVKSAGAWRRLAMGTLAAVAALAVASCGDDDGGGNAAGGSGERKLILLAMPFPCDLNDYASNLCDGARDAARKLPDGYTLQVKTGVDYADVPAFNNLIQTSLQLDPAGLIVFPNGAAAQSPVLNKACSSGVKVVFLDSATENVPCGVSTVTAPDSGLGRETAKWLIANPPANGSKEVAVVTQKPGQFAANDKRVKAFKDTVAAAGFKVVSTVVTSNDLDQTRSLVTNTLTAHPKLGAIFSANGPMGQGTSQALKRNRGVVHVTLDGNVSEVKNILSGTASANTAFSSYELGQLVVQFAAKAVRGEAVPKTAEASLKVIDAKNADEYIKSGGLR